MLFTKPMVRAIFDGKKTMTRRLKCHVQAGDVVWVKETFCPRYFDDGRAAYRADWPDARIEDVVPDPKWRASILMPRRLSRVLLAVLSVRVEPLQAITPADILAEGVVLRSHQDQNLGKCPISAFDEKLYPDLRSLWVAAWDGINGKKAPWSSNPAVHVVSFRRV